jgi:hypothetical protein
MNRYLLPMAILLIGLTGCAASHYADTKPHALLLYLRAPQAKQVRFASSIDNFQLHPTTKNNQDYWWIELPKDKEFSYFYLVDGMLHTPVCQLKEVDDFGSENCIYMPPL